jgi:lysophospholipase L1-like esterase
MRKSRLRNLLLNLLMVMASSIISLFFIEISLRLFWQNPAKYAQAGSESLFWRYDSLLGWTMLPNVQGRYVRPEFTVEVKANSLGLRDDEIALTKTKSEFRILLLGDSVTAGFEVARSETYEALLESQLNHIRDGWNYQVINAGFRGYGTDQELLFIKSRGLALQPDVVILAFVPANDLEDNVTVHVSDRIYTKPYFEYSADSSLVLRGVPVPDYPFDQHIYSNVIRDSTASHSTPMNRSESSIKKIIRENLYLYGFLAQRLKNADPRLVAMLKRTGLLQHTTREAFLDFYRSQLPENWQRRWQLTLDLLLQIKRLCDAQHAPLVVWMFPLKEQVYERDRRILLEEYGLKSEDYDFARPEVILRRFCQRHDILFMSPLARFREEAARGKRMHFISDNHFNAAGHALLADELSEFLQAHELLDKGQ